MDTASTGKTATYVGRFGNRHSHRGYEHARRDVLHIFSLPVSTVIIGCDSIAQLEENVQLAQNFTPLSQSQMASLNALAEPVAKQSLFFRFTDRTNG